MQTDQIAVLIPIIFLLVLGLVLALVFYFDFRSKQMLIQKAGSLEEYKAIMEANRNKNSKGLFKAGIVLIFFGFGIGFGIMADEVLKQEFLVPLLIFVFTGAGFVAAHKLSEKKTPTEEIK
ncbi:MAG: hypothetical protein HUU54_17015 [Ignavibacteriaceae bacterium]|nr:hypothetical protein [Ignavibacteriaceae bacterium]